MSNRNVDFDFKKFATKAIKQIDEMRSYFDLGISSVGGQQSSSNDPTKSIVKQKESRINAFYRMLGLPAVMSTDQKYYANNIVPQIDPNNNGNVHKGLSFDDEVKEKLDKRQMNFTHKVDSEEINKFLYDNKQTILSAIADNQNKESSQNKVEPRLRGQLFPMVVDGRIRIYPARRRVAGAFMSKTNPARRWEKDIFRTPLIEQILYIRLKGDNVVNSSHQDSVNTAVSSTSLKEISKDFADDLNRTLFNIGKIYEEALKQLNKSRVNLGEDVVPTAVNVAQANPDIKPQTLPKRKGQTSIQKEQIAARKAIKNAKLALFAFDDVDAEFDTKNLQGEGLISSLLETQIPTKGSILDKIEKKVERELKGLRETLKSATQDMDLLLGTFAGISGVDILAIIIALFQIEEKYLIALLNKDSRDRLRKIKGNIDSLSAAENTDVRKAIRELQDQVSEILREAYYDVNSIAHSEKGANKKPQGASA